MVLFVFIEDARLDSIVRRNYGSTGDVVFKQIQLTFRHTNIISRGS